MLKKTMLMAFIALGPLSLMAIGNDSSAKSFSLDSYSGINHQKEIDLDTADLDFGDAELGYDLFHKVGKECRDPFVYDYIIVGNGTAGATLANKLSKNRKTRVLVIEAGANRSTDPVVNTAAFDLNTITYNPRYAATYTSPPFSTSPGGQVHTYTEGRMWGGGSGHHYLNYVRGTPEAYDAWAASAADPRWSYNNMLPIFKKMETYTSNGSPINTAERGTDGPVFSTQEGDITGNLWAIALQTATAAPNTTLAGGLGIPFVNDYNDASESPVGVSPRQLFITPDKTLRSWAVPAYLAPGVVVDEDGNGLDGRQLKIISNSLVNKVIFEGNAAVGVEFVQADDDTRGVKVYARKQVILAAGAINSPAILQRSGIGDPAILEPLDIPVLVANSNVGANMKNHYGAMGYLAGPLTPQILQAFTDMHPYMPADSNRRYQVSVQNVGGQLRLQGWNLNPQSSGSVQIINKSALTQPRINFNFYSDGGVSTVGSDAYLAVSFLKLAQNLATLMGTTIISPTAAQYASDDTLFAAVQGSSNATALGNSLNFVITSHMVGTTRMSSSPNTGVVDGNLNVYGTRRLKVVDIGIQPRITDGNTCVSAYAIGLRAWDIIKNGD